MDPVSCSNICYDVTDLQNQGMANPLNASVALI